MTIATGQRALASDVLAAIAGANAVYVIAAAGSGQGSATTVSAAGSISIVTSAPSGSGVKLLNVAGSQKILNRTSLSLLVYPPTGGMIEANLANAAVLISSGGSAEFHSRDGSVFYAT